MALKTGDRIGRFEIAGLLGAGGMGEVYRARDPDLERDVAVKVLPADFAQDRMRQARFEREARAVARLGHPNLLAVHDVGRHRGTPYLVCELLTGQTLRERLDSGPVAVREVLEWAPQIAEGLAAAHEEGIVHRDVKPSNLFITEDEHVKILDFGLAKAVSAGGDRESELRTLTEISRPGAVVGTSAYMAPEQAAGQEVDHRADQFALGVVLYELLTGSRPFAGGGDVETLASLLRDDPEPLAQLAPRAPLPLRWIVERCLRRDPRERYASTRDLALDLRTIAERARELRRDLMVGAEADVRDTVGHSRPVRVALLAVSFLIGAGLAAWFATRHAPTAASLSYERVTFQRGTVGAARFTDDGVGLLYSAAWDGRPSRIHLHRAAGQDPLMIGPEGSRLLSVSPDGDLLFLTDQEAVGPFSTAGALARMPLAGAPRTLGVGVADAVFGPDGELGAVVREAGGKLVLEFPPGTERLSTRGLVLDLRLSADGKRLAFIETASRGRNAGSITVLDRDGGENQLGGDLRWGLAWSASGDELWFSDGSAVQALSLAGAQREVATFPAEVTLYDISPTGRVLLGTEAHRYEMAGRSADTPERELTWRGWSAPFDISNDGETILFNECTPSGCRAALRGFGADPPIVLGEGFGVALSPSGDWVASAPPWSPQELNLIATATEERHDLILDGVERIALAAWTPGGDAIWLNANMPGQDNRIIRLDLDDNRLVPLTPEGIDFGFFAVSPDGHSVAATLADGGIALYPAEGGEPTLFEVDEQPIQWSSDGRFIYSVPLASMPAALRRIDVASGASEILAHLRPADPAGVTQISPVAVTPDGSAYVYGYVRRLTDLYVVEGME